MLLLSKISADGVNAKDKNRLRHRNSQTTKGESKVMCAPLPPPLVLHVRPSGLVCVGFLFLLLLAPHGDDTLRDATFVGLIATTQPK